MTEEFNKPVVIKDWASRFTKSAAPLTSHKVVYSPDGKFAVIELFKDEVFVGVRVLENDTETNVLYGEYLSSFEDISWDVSIRNYTIDWDSYEFGLAKLHCHEYGDDGFKNTTIRLKLKK
jgi:hypothetical protein